MRQLMIFYASLFLLFACKKEEQSELPQPVSNRIRFDALAIGQVSNYLCLNGYGYYPLLLGSYFEYTDDTLRLEIVAKDDNGFKVAETLHYVGTVYPSMSGTTKDSTFYYYLRVSNDTLRFSPIGSWYVRSRIFRYQAATQGLSLHKITSPKVMIKDWRTDLPSFANRYEGYVESYTQFGQEFSNVS